jgi:hypothetical protein
MAQRPTVEDNSLPGRLIGPAASSRGESSDQTTLYHRGAEPASAQLGAYRKVRNRLSSTPPDARQVREKTGMTAEIEDRIDARNRTACG